MHNISYLHTYHVKIRKIKSLNKNINYIYNITDLLRRYFNVFLRLLIGIIKIIKIMILKMSTCIRLHK